MSNTRKNPTTILVIDSRGGARIVKLSTPAAKKFWREISQDRSPTLPPWEISWVTTKNEWNKPSKALFEVLVEKMIELIDLGLKFAEKIVVHMPNGGNKLKKALKNALGKREKLVSFKVHKTKKKDWEKVVEDVTKTARHVVVSDAAMEEFQPFSSRYGVGALLARSDDEDKQGV